MKKEITIVIVLMAVAVTLAIAGAVFLPNFVVVQVNFNGEATTRLPRMVAVVLPLAITGFGSFRYYKNSSEKDIAIAVVGILISILDLVFNL